MEREIRCAALGPLLALNRDFLFSAFANINKLEQ